MHLQQDVSAHRSAVAAGRAQRWRTLALDALEAGNPARALQCWREVGRREPDALDAMFNLGCCHVLIDEPGRACLIFEALSQAQTAPLALRQRAARLAALVDPMPA